MQQLFSYSWHAIGTEIKILSPSSISKNIIEEMKNFIEKYEQKFSRFRPDSSLSILNTTKALKNDIDMIELCLLAQKIYKDTNTAFNPLLSVKNLGYTTSYLRPDKLDTSPYNINFLEINICLETQTIQLQKDQNLDLGGIAKGWITDKLVLFLQNKGLKNFLVNAGGDIFAAGKVSSTEAWTIEVESTGQITKLCNQAIATSGKNKRHWLGKDGKTYHHILNPITKNSADNELQAISVIAQTCAEADAWATAAFSLGKIEGQNLLIYNNKQYFLCL